MKIILSHPTGNANVRALTSGFAKTGVLENFITTIACFDDSILLKTGFKEFEKRRYHNRLKKYTVTKPWIEIGRLAAAKLGLNFLTTKENAVFSVDAVYKNLDRHVAKLIENNHSIDVVYGYEDGAYHSFKVAKKHKLHCAYELPIAYWETARKLLALQAEKYPRWKNTLAGGITDSVEKIEKKTLELELADSVIVPSSFVADSLPEWCAHKKITIAPFGTPGQKSLWIKKDLKNRPLRLLFVGSMSQRKGLADLFQAIHRLNTSQIELIVLGSLADEIGFYKKELPDFKYEPPRNHAEVLKFMETCDIFCLPSIVEGRALVMQEAMSRQLPIIITENTGGKDLIKDAETGFLVPIGNSDAIASKLDWFLNNRDKIKDMGMAAAEHASTYTWEKYCKIILDSLNNSY